MLDLAEEGEAGLVGGLGKSGSLRGVCCGAITIEAAFL
jgi:hypothetical protein